jgi:hypothetical protein
MYVDFPADQSAERTALPADRKELSFAVRSLLSDEGERISAGLQEHN